MCKYANEKMFDFFKNKTEKLLSALIQGAEGVGLPEKDLNTAKEYLEHREYGLCFETILEQLCENDIVITKEYYNLIEKIAIKMEIRLEDYLFMRDLVVEE